MQPWTARSAMQSGRDVKAIRSMLDLEKLKSQHES